MVKLVETYTPVQLNCIPPVPTEVLFSVGYASAHEDTVWCVAS